MDVRKSVENRWFAVSLAFLLLLGVTAAGPAAAQTATMVSPVALSTLEASQVFTWSDTSGGTRYFLYLGSCQGCADYYNEDQGTNLTARVAGLPWIVAGSPAVSIWARLWTWTGTAWVYADYEYFARTDTVTDLARMTTPANNGDPLTTPVVFEWTPSVGVDKYWLSVGTTGVGSSDLYYKGVGTNTSIRLNNLPKTGTIYVRLWSLFGNYKPYLDYNYQTGISELTAPVGDTLGALPTFEWTDVGASQYWLHIGSTQGGAEYYNQDQYANLTAPGIPGLPFNSTAVWVRLWTKMTPSSNWAFSDRLYTSNGSGITDLAVITSPAQGTTLPGPLNHFTWSSVASPAVSKYWVAIGTTGPGSYDLLYQDMRLNTEAWIDGLPTAQPIYVRLYTLCKDYKPYQDYVYNP